jgi:hypothetical protein
MALLFTEGFDTYPSSMPISAKWSVAAATGTQGSGRSGGFSYQQNVFATFGQTLPEMPSCVFGFAVYLTSQNDYYICTVNNKYNNTCFFIAVNNSYQVYVIDALGTTDLTSYTMSLNNWYYIEAKLTSATTSAPAGSLTIQVTGPSTTTPTQIYSSPSGRAFNSNALSLATTVGWFGRHSQFYDDIYICDLTGANNNNFLGPVIIQTIFPHGPGSSTQFSPVGAASNWQAVSETAFDGDATYVQSTTVNAKDLYTMGSISGLYTVQGVMVNAVLRKDAAGARTVKTIAKNTNEVDGVANYVSGGYQTLGVPLDTNPAGGSWLLSGVNTLQTGVTISS